MITPRRRPRYIPTPDRSPPGTPRRPRSRSSTSAFPTSGVVRPRPASTAPGLVTYVYAQLGVDLPHFAAAQWGYGVPVPVSQLQPGDLVFFNELDHVGIYLGDNEFIDAPHTGSFVRIDTLAEPWYATTTSAPGASERRLAVVDCGPVPEQPYGSALAAELADDVLERFLRYVRIDTQSARESATYPSTARQLELSRLLADELRGLGLDGGRADRARLRARNAPAVGADGGPTVGLLAHVDTRPDAPGAGVDAAGLARLRRRRARAAGRPAQMLSPATNPLLGGADRPRHRHLRRDDAPRRRRQGRRRRDHERRSQWLLAHPEVSRARARIGFTVDEEVGRGTEHFDLEQLRRRLRLHGRRRDVGEIENETFSRRRAEGELPRRRDPSRLRQREARQPDQARRALRREPPGRPALARDDRGAGGLSCTRSRSPAARAARP